SSRRRHTRFSRDWSSDVCSSDLTLEAFQLFALRCGELDQLRVVRLQRLGLLQRIAIIVEHLPRGVVELLDALLRRLGFGCQTLRSEERRVGTECRMGCAE